MAERGTALDEVERYYSAKLQQHGATARGVDWSSEASQETRFEQLARIIDRGEPFTLNDLGCGYGALFDYLAARFRDFAYRGVDVSEPMIRAAAERHPGEARAAFSVGARCPGTADFSVASGIFNVRLNADPTLWGRHVEETLDHLHAVSVHGFAFNSLTSYSDADKMRPDLYYADPCRLFDHCKRRYSGRVALLHDYGLWEFTILVRKAP